MKERPVRQFSWFDASLIIKDDPSLCMRRIESQCHHNRRPHTMYVFASDGKLYRMQDDGDIRKAIFTTGVDAVWLIFPRKHLDAIVKSIGAMH